MLLSISEYKKNNVVHFIKKKHHRFIFHSQNKSLNVLAVGIGGDCITLVSKLLNINAYESAKQINNIFSLGVNFNGYTSKYEVNRYKQIQDAKERFKNWHNKTIQLLCDYLHSLEGVEKLQQESIIQYYIDLLIFGTEEDWLWFKKTEERWCRKIERKLGTRNVERESTL